MTVYGEEAVRVSFNKGLWANGSPDTIEEGYCSEFYNLEITPEGSVVPRGEILHAGFCTARGFLNGTSKQDFYPGRGAVDTQDHWKTISSSNYQYSVAITGGGGSNNLNTQTSASATIWIAQFTTAAHFPTDMAQYRDRIYIAASGNNDIAYLNSNNLATVGPLATTVVATLGTPVIRLIAFKDRLFAFSANRIYYTEVAAVGGYPDNWATTINVIEMPSSGSQVITAHVLNDRLYIFTADAVYTLAATGSVSTWRLELNTPNIQVSKRRRICVVKNNFVWTDDFSVYMWPGFGNPVEIGQPIAYHVKSHQRTRCFAYREGVLVTSTSWSSGATQAFYKHFYFNGSYWVEIRLESDRDPIVGTFPKAINWQSLNLDPMGGEELLVTDVRFSVVGQLQTGTITCSFTTRDITTPAWETLKRYKYAYVNFHTIDTAPLSTFTYYTRIEGSGSDFNQGSFAQNVGVSTDKNATVKIKAPQFSNRIAYKFEVGLMPVARASAAKHPLVKFKDLRLIFNSDNRNAPERTTP